MKHQVEKITPEIARQFLAKNLSNRPLRKTSTVAVFAAAMKRGEWVLNGDAIRFSSDGILLDGQHRLEAVVKSGATIYSLVVYGLPPSTFDTIDRGRPRTTGDMLAIRGEKNYTALASVARLGFMWEVYGDPFYGNPGAQPTVRQIEAYVDENPIIRDAVQIVTVRKWIKKYITPRIGGFSVYAFLRSDLASCVPGFVDALVTGEKSQTNCAAFLLRDALVEDKSARDQMPDKYKVPLIFKAFKKFAAGESTKTLRIRMAGDAVEKDLYLLPGAEIGSRSDPKASARDGLSVNQPGVFAVASR